MTERVCAICKGPWPGKCKCADNMEKGVDRIQAGAKKKFSEAVFAGELALAGDDFRRVIATTKRTQLVIMSLLPAENIGAETHPDTDQALFVVAGEGVATINGQSVPVTDNSVVYVPAGSRHDVVNVGMGSLKLFTVYSPPEHAPGTVHHTKADAAKEKKS